MGYFQHVSRKYSAKLRQSLGYGEIPPGSRLLGDELHPLGRGGMTLKNANRI